MNKRAAGIFLGLGLDAFVCVRSLHQNFLLLPPHLTYFPGEGGAARSGRRAGTTSKKMAPPFCRAGGGAGLEGGAAGGEAGGRSCVGRAEGLGYVGVPGRAKRHHRGRGPEDSGPSPSFSYPLTSNLCFFSTQGSRGERGQPGATGQPGPKVWAGWVIRPPCSSPAAAQAPQGLPEVLPVGFVLKPESYPLCLRAMWARMGPLGSLEKR